MPKAAQQWKGHSKVYTTDKRIGVNVGGVDNAYTNHSLAAAWQEKEGERLRTMGEYANAVTRQDLGPIFSELQADTARQTPLELIDLGAGPDTGVEEFCAAHEVGYTAYDGNSDYLQQRGTDPSHTIVGRLEDLSAITDGAYGISLSRAATGWSRDPDHTIAEQLRITSEVAVFTEYDWGHAAVLSDDHEVAAAGLTVKMGMVRALESAKFNTEMGAELQKRVADVARTAGYIISQEHVRHELPQGDHRALFLDSVETLLAQLRGVYNNADSSAAARSGAGAIIGMIERPLAVIRDAPEGSITFRLPALVSEVVRIVSRP